mgnify:CR=1 FL=1
MNNKVLSFIVMVLTLSVMVVNNLNELYTLKTIVNSIVLAGYVFVFMEYMKNRRESRKAS